jgi:hypothetical protein
MAALDQEIQELHDAIVMWKFGAARSIVLVSAIVSITVIALLTNWWWTPFVSWPITIYAFADLFFFTPKKRRYYKARLDQIKEQE